MTEEQIEKLKKLLDLDMPVVKIAKEVGMSYNTLRLHMEKDDYEIKRRLVKRVYTQDHNNKQGTIATIEGDLMNPLITT